MRVLLRAVGGCVRAYMHVRVVHSGVVAVEKCH